MNELPELLDHYFSLGVAEGKEGRDHDTKDGEAQATRDLIDQKILRLQRELEEAKEFRAILEGHLGAAIDDYNEARRHIELLQEKDASQCGCSIDRPDDVCLFHARMKAEARKAALIEAAEIASGVASRLVGPVKIGPAAAAAMEIAATLRGKAEETRA